MPYSCSGILLAMQRNELLETGEMAQQARELAPFVEDKEFSSQHPHGSSWKSVTPGSEDLIPLQMLKGQGICTLTYNRALMHTQAHTHLHACTYTHT